MNRLKALIVIASITAGSFISACVPPPSGGDSNSTTPPATGSISGTVYPPERVLLDSDTRDTTNPSTSNNSLALAQSVPNLVMVTGNADSAVDPDDYFTTTLTAGETVKLIIGDSAADLDLYLYQAGSTVTSSTGPGKAVETLASPGAGAYQVRVRALTGGSNYQLQLGTLTWSSTRAAGAPPEGDFVPGEVLTQMKPPTGPVAAGNAPALMRSRAEGAAGRHGIKVKNFSPNGLTRMVFDTGVGPDDPNGADEARIRTLKRVEELKSDPDVLYAEPNYIVRPALLPNDTYFNRQWNLPNINLPAAWDLTTGSASVIVAVVDTGVLYNHPDLTANILRDGGQVVGYDMISNVLSANDGDGPDPDPYDSGDEADTTQSSYHGTHVAGIIGAVGNNATGVSGVSWNVRIMPVRVLGKNDGSSFDVAEGIKFAAGVANAYGVFPKVGGVTTPADIINLSLGGSGYSQPIQDAINMARTAGVTVVAAAGNDSTSSFFYPAACTGVIGVSSVDYAGELAYYSNYGTYIDLAAPGGDVYADRNHDTFPDGILSTLAVGLKTPTSFNYVFYQGTSMAAPHIAGVIALMKAYHASFAAPGNELTPEEIDKLINGTTPGIDSITNYARAHRDNYLGYGIIDAEKAVLAAGALAGSTTGINADLALEPEELNFGFTTNVLPTSIVNLGVEALTNITVSPYAYPWLSHDLNGQILSVTVDRSSLADGYYEADLTINSDNGGSEPLKIKAYKGTTVVSNVGTIYVMLIDSKGNAVTMVSTNRSAGYLYTFGEVKKGVYQILAGTDLDNDGYIGDPGEFFGRYPSASLPQSISLYAGQNLVGRDFNLQPTTTATLAVRRLP